MAGRSEQGSFANRQGERLAARLEEAAESGHRGDGQHVLCCLDLDRFKVVNDTSGHVAGDNVLREVAKVLRDAVREPPQGRPVLRLVRVDQPGLDGGEAAGGHAAGGGRGRGGGGGV